MYEENNEGAEEEQSKSMSIGPEKKSLGETKSTNEKNEDGKK